MAASETALRVITFFLHFASAIFLLHVAFKCSSILKTNIYTETVTDPTGYAVVMNSTCDDPYSRECFYGLPQAYDVIQHSLGWNVFALLAAFEWLSASFALYYLDDILRGWWSNAYEVTTTACLVWNFLGIFTIMPYSMPLTMLQAGITTLALLTASAAQVTSVLPLESEDQSQCNIPGRNECSRNNGTVVIPMPGQLNRHPTNVTVGRDRRTYSMNRVVQHYTEYCTSASLLFVAVLILFIPDPISWAPIFGFTGIMICNITGIGAHNCKLDAAEDALQTPWYDLDWTKCGNHFKLFMLHSWLALTSSVLIIVYLSRDTLTSSAVPGWVRFILWNLLITYTLFGVWATFCYAMAGARVVGGRFDRWMERLDYGLTVLSAAAKLPVAYTVFYGLIQEPGAKICDI